VLPGCEGESRLHRLRQGESRGQRPDHHGELVDQAIVRGVQEVAAFQVAIPDASLEQQRVVARARTADLAHIAEFLEYLGGGGQDRRDGSTAVVGLEHDRAAEDDIVGEQREGTGQISGFDRGAKWVHGLAFRSPRPPWLAHTADARTISGTPVRRAAAFAMVAYTLDGTPDQVVMADPEGNESCVP
jgi:hypothetical protein